LSEEKDYGAIYIACYLCNKVGHISIDCEEQFEEVKGNLKK